MYYNNKKLIISIFWIVLGILLILLAGFEVIESDMWSGFGGGLVAVGISQLIRNIVYRKNEKFREKVDISATDERNGQIRMKAWSYTGFTLVFLSGVLTIIFSFAHLKTLSLYSAYTECIIILLYYIYYLIFSKTT